MKKKDNRENLKRFPFSSWRKNRDNSCYLSVFYSYKDAFGKFRKVEMICHDHTLEGVIEIRNKLKEIAEGKINKQKFGIVTDEATTTFSELSERWVNHKKKTVRPNTAKTYQRIINAHLSVLDNTLISQIDSERLNKIIEKLIKDNKFRSSQFVYRILSSMFAFAVKKKLLNENAAKDLVLPKNQKPKQIEVLTQNEAQSFLTLCKTHKHGLLFEFALMTGMRPEEYLGLRWTDLDFRNNLVIIRHAVDLETKDVVFQNVKSINSKRSIPLTSALADKLKAHQKIIKDKKFQFDFNFVFPSQNGKFLDRKNLAVRHFKPLMEKVNKSKNAHLYMLRHTCATLLLLAGENPKVVAERLGNSVEVVLKNYSHVSPNMQKSASEKLEKMIAA